MQGVDELARVVWPQSRGAELVALLARTAGWGFAATPSTTRDSAAEADMASLMRWSSEQGLELQSVDCRLSDLQAFLAAAPPALMALPGAEGGQGGLVAIVRSDAHRLWCLDRDGAPAPVRAAALRERLLGAQDPRSSALLEALVAQASPNRAQREQMIRAIEDVQGRARRVHAGWIVRPGPAAPVRARLAEAGVWRFAALCVGAGVLSQTLIVLSWALIAQPAGASGRMATALVNAWSLAFVASALCSAVAFWSESVLSVKLTAVFRQQVLHALRRHDDDALRATGVTQTIGYAMEVDALEHAGLAGAFAAAAALPRLVVALCLVVFGGHSALVGALLAAWSCLIAVALVSVWHTARPWGDACRALADDLVAKMRGHLTYVTQLPAAQRHRDEDPQLSEHWRRSAPLHRRLVFVGSAARGWLAVGFLGLLYDTAKRGADAPDAALLLIGVVTAFEALAALCRSAPTLVTLSSAWCALGWLLGTPRAPGSTSERDPVHRVGAAGAGSSGAPGTPENSTAAQCEAPLIALENVVYAYPGRAQPVLAGVGLRIERGQRVWLEGPSGAGKSTLAGLVSGARLAHAGTVRIDGEAVGPHTADTLRGRVIDVPQFQQNHIFSASLAFNLLMGRRWPPEADDLADAERLCAELNLHTLVEQMPAGLQQYVGEGGWTLSHGERSRVFIARALLQSPDLVILDESFGALDPENFATSLICAVRHARTLLVIAHP
jgi:ATP-binding cassette subfamily B protein